MLAADELATIARLARLELTAQEQQTLAVELTAVLAHMEALAAVDTQGIAPMIYGVAPPQLERAATPASEAPGGEDDEDGEDGEGARMAADDVLPVKLALAGAAAVRAGQFVVPNVLPERP